MPDDRVHKVSVIGCGYMGWVFGLQCAAHGIPVSVYNPRAESLKGAREKITNQIESWIEQEKIAPQERNLINARLHFTSELDEAVAEADLVLEALPEQLELKREIFARLDEVAPERAILATGSSSLPISRIEDVTQRPDRVINTHYYLPIWQIPMGELMRGSATSDETVDRVKRFMRAIGVVPLMVLSESTGFMFNRIWRAIKKECLTVADAGVASYEDIDRAWSIFVGIFKNLPGPFALMDTIGLDTVLDIEKVYHEKSGSVIDEPPDILTKRVARQELGVKSGKGFYAYPNPSFEEEDWLNGQGITE